MVFDAGRGVGADEIGKDVGLEFGGEGFERGESASHSCEIGELAIKRARRVEAGEEERL